MELLGENEDAGGRVADAREFLSGDNSDQHCATVGNSRQQWAAYSEQQWSTVGTDALLMHVTRQFCRSADKFFTVKFLQLT